MSVVAQQPKHTIGKLKHSFKRIFLSPKCGGLVDVLKEAIPVWEPNNAREEAYKDGCRAAVYFVQRKMFLLKESSREQLE